MIWWLWELLGFVLLGLELATPGMFLAFFFGIGAILVGILAGIGLVEIYWLQWILFSALSLGAFFGLRKPLQGRFNLGADTKQIDSMVGEQTTVVEPILTDASGRVSFRGTTWTARSKAKEPIAVGTQCKIESVDGLTLWVVQG